MKEKLPTIEFLTGFALRPQPGKAPEWMFPKGFDTETLDITTTYTVVYDVEWGMKIPTIFRIEPTPDWVLKARNVIAGYKEMLVHGL